MATTSHAHSSIHVNFSQTVEGVKATADEIIERVTRAHDTVGSLKAGEHTFENTVLALAYNDGEEDASGSSVSFHQYVSTDSALRDASSEQSKVHIALMGLSLQRRSSSAP